MAYVFYESGLSINVMYTIDDGGKRAVGFKLSDGMEVPEELAPRFKFARQKSKLAGTIRGSYFVIKGEYCCEPAGDLGPLPDRVWVHVDRVLIAIAWRCRGRARREVSPMTTVRRTLLARTGARGLIRTQLPKQGRCPTMGPRSTATGTY